MEETNTQTHDIEISPETGGKQINAIMSFVKSHLKNGRDYMKIAGSNKPSLLKSGAEKMNILMGYSATYEKLNEVMNRNDEYYYSEIKCTLTDKHGRIRAEGIGSCNNKEKARANIPFYDSLNPVLKVAEKRAYVAATLNANALSQLYTQDIEDAPQADNRGLCANCGVVCSDKVVEYSMKRWNGKVLCRDCQKTVEEARRKTQ